MLHTPSLAHIRGEYLKMPGVRLASSGAVSSGVDGTLCKMMLDALVKAKLLCVHSGGTTRGQSTDEPLSVRNSRAQISEPAQVP